MTAPHVYFAHPLLRARDWQDRPEFDQLCQWWKSRAAGVCALVGIGGAGKTAIAERFLRVLPNVTAAEPHLPKDASLRAPDRLFVFSFYDAPNADRFFAELAAWLESKPFDESAPVPSFYQTLALVQASPGCLLVLDGLEKVQDDGARGGVFGQITDRRLSDLVQRLALGLVPGVAAIITTRFPIAELEEQEPSLYTAVDVDEISEEAGIALLRQRGVKGPDSELRRIVNECGRHALTVDLAGGYIAEFGHGDPKTPLCLETTDELERRITAEPNPRRRDVLRQEYRFARVAERYQEGLAQKDPAALALLQRVCLFRLGVNADMLASIFTGEGKEDIAGEELATLSKERLEQKLRLLTEMRLLEADKSEVYTVHPAVRDGFLSGLDAESARTGHDAIRKKLTVRLDALPGARDRTWDAHSLDLVEEVIHHTREAGYFAEAWDLFWCRGNPCSFMGSHGGYDRVERICRTFLPRYTDVEESVLSQLSPPCQAALLHTTALCLCETGRLTEAEPLFIKVLALPVSTCAAPAIYNLADVQKARGYLAKSRATIEARAPVIEGLNDPKEIAALDALLAELNSLQGKAKEALIRFCRALAVPLRLREPWDAFHHLRRVDYAHLLIKLGRSEDAESELRTAMASVRSLTGPGDNEWTIPCHLMFAQLQMSRNRASQTQESLTRVCEWAQSRGAREELCTAALVTGKVKFKAAKDKTEAAPGPRRSDDLEAAGRAIKEGLHIARDCGLGIHHIDLLLVRAQVALYEGRADDALHDVTVALDEGIHPSPESGLPTLLAANDPECGYAWGIAEGLHLRGEGLLLKAAQKLGQAEFAPAKLQQLPDGVRELIAEGREQLESSLDLWRKLRDPESDAEINPHGEATKRALEQLEGGVLTAYPIDSALPEDAHADALSEHTTDTPPAKRAKKRSKAVTKKHVFLSYCHDNSKEVAQLRDDLIRAREHVWWDQDILGGQDWRREIRKAMKEAYAVVVCFSRETDARSKSGIFPELLDAIKAYRKYAPGSIFLIPIRLSKCSIPDVEISDTQTLDSLQYVDLFPPSKRADGLQRLIESLHKAADHLSPSETAAPDAARQDASAPTEGSPLGDLFLYLEKESHRSGSDPQFSLAAKLACKHVPDLGDLRLREGYDPDKTFILLKAAGFLLPSADEHDDPLETLTAAAFIYAALLDATARSTETWWPVHTVAYSVLTGVLIGNFGLRWRLNRDAQRRLYETATGAGERLGPNGDPMESEATEPLLLLLKEYVPFLGR